MGGGGLAACFFGDGRFLILQKERGTRFCHEQASPTLYICNAILIVNSHCGDPSAFAELEYLFKAYEIFLAGNHSSCIV